MPCPPRNFNKIRLTIGFLFAGLLISSLGAMPVLSATAAFPVGRKSSVRDQNATYLPLTFNSWRLVPARIYCMGDSLTDAGEYEIELEKLLGPKWSTVEVGRSADTTANMLARFQADVIDPGDAAYVIIWGGANDIRLVTPEDSETSLQAMYTMAHDAGIKVVAVTITPLNSEPAQNKENILAINAWIMKLPQDVDFIADAYTAINDPDNPGNLLPLYDSGDHAHLSQAGYARVAETIYAATTWVWQPPK
jgi:lysophospholipase L1-like esterase